MNHAAYRIIASRNNSNNGGGNSGNSRGNFPGNSNSGRRRTRSYPEASLSAAKRRFLSGGRRRRSCPLMAPRLATVAEETAEELENC